MAERARKELRLSGIPLSEGCAVARVCMFNEKRHSNLPRYKVEGKGVEREVARVEQAVRTVGDALEDIRLRVSETVGDAEAEIFVAQRMIMEDPSLFSKIKAAITDDKLNAESAIARVLDEYEEKLSALDNQYIRERASDFGEIKRRLLDVLSNTNPSVQCADEAHCQKGRNRIVVAEELTPALSVDLDTANLLGFVTEHGGVNSHGAILARALGIPAVGGLTGVRQKVACGSEILLNGDTGEVIVWPSEKTVAALNEVAPNKLRQPTPHDPVPGFAVMANIGLARDACEVLMMRAEGVGLYRTELELLAAGRILNEDELYQTYFSVADALDGRPVIFRAFDLSSDKRLPSMDIGKEDNPALGWRGVRLLLGMPHVFVPQARALARLSQRMPVSIMYPMVSDREQFVRIREQFAAATEDMEKGDIRHGVMFEIPAACLQAREIFEEAEFGSVGTNDLTQYLFAVDRDNERLAEDYDPDKSAFWTILREVIAAARDSGRPLSICGEMAADPKYIPRLIESGVETVSVSARRISVVRSVADAVLNPESVQRQEGG